MRTVCGIVILLITLIGGSVLGQDEMEITVDVLEPSESPGVIPPGIQYLEDKISRSPLKYQSYLELATAFRSIPIGKKETINFNLRQQIKLVIIPKKVGSKTVQFSLKLWSGDRLVLDTDLSLIKQGTVMIGAPGKPYLIIAISEGF